jgi:hypothetical protein
MRLTNPLLVRENPPMILGFGEKNLCFKPFDGFKNLGLKTRCYQIKHVSEI